MNPVIVCNFLNYLLEKDKATIDRLFETRVPCADILCEDKFLVVTEEDTVGALGLLNGILGYSESKSLLVAVYDENGLVRFEVRS